MKHVLTSIFWHTIYWCSLVVRRKFAWLTLRARKEIAMTHKVIKSGEEFTLKAGQEIVIGDVNSASNPDVEEESEVVHDDSE